MAKRSRSREGAAARTGGGRARPGSPRARLFLALEPVEADRARLAAWRDAALAGREDLRPVAAGSLHLTLVFLGYRPEKEIPRIAQVAFEAIAGAAAVDLEPREVRAVPPRSPRLFALDLADPGGRAAAIQEAAAKALERERLHEREKRAWWPHLTIARVKRGARASPLAVAAPEGPLRADTITLYRSQLRPQGALYTPEARHRLP
ncbi:MAG TPA: RNA 2',3'-cyclic phosphodiesterase [Thermoleophilaceae bacterium]